MDYRCPRCKMEKPRDKVYLRKTGTVLRCKDCQAEMNRVHYASNPERRKKQKRDARRRELLKVYGLTMEQYEVLVEEAGGICRICQREKPLQVDHVEGTHIVRGMICGSCNKAIGLLQHDVVVMERAIEYLRGPFKGSPAQRLSA